MIGIIGPVEAASPDQRIRSARKQRRLSQYVRLCTVRVRARTHWRHVHPNMGEIGRLGYQSSCLGVTKRCPTQFIPRHHDIDSRPGGGVLLT